MIRIKTARTLTWQTPLPTVNPIAEFAHSYAITIGIDGYGRGIPPLRTAANDARLLADLLQEQHGYYTACMTEAVTYSALKTLFARRLPDQIGAEDRLLIHFAGHGVALDGDDGPRGYLLPQDAEIDEPDSFLSMQTFRAWLDRLPCRHLLLILDCCFAGAFRWSGTRDTRRMRDTLPAERYHHYLTSRSWQVVTSAAHNERAYDQLVYHNILGQRGETLYDGKPHSPFALALFEGLAGGADLWPRGQGDGVITAGELQVHLSQQVASVTRNAQTPQLWPLPQHDRGEFLFLTPGRIPSLPAAKPLDAENSPWRGLQPYRAADAEIFCGRDALAAQLTQLVVEQANPLVVVVGGSGTGKSSLVQAGLIPRLRQMHTSEGMAIWRVLATVRPGSEPVRTMVQQVQGALAGEETPPEDEGEACHWCADRIQAWLEEHPERRMLLVIDQFEEIVTFCRDEAERKRFLTLLGWLLAQQFARLQIIITLRSDFEPHFRDLPFSDLWRQGRFVVRSLSSEELHDIVEGPAEVREIYFESAGLVSSIVDEVAQTPGALPLLSFTLHELYLRYLQRQEAARHRDQIIERCLTTEDYVDLGGVVGALGRRASDLCARLTPDEQASMQRIMLRMVATEGGELARRRVAQWELDFDPPAEAARVKAVIDKLVAARLVVEDLDPVANEEYVEPAHDALIRAWDRILQWRDEAGDLLPLQRRLTRAARDWMRAAPEEQSRLLWTNNARLPQVHQMLAPRDYPSSEEEAVMPAGDRTRLLRRLFNPTVARPRVPTPLNRVETDFVLQSIQKRAALLRRIALIVTATVLALAMLAGVATWQWRTAVNNRIAELEQTSLRDAESALDMLAAKPFESLKLALEAMPREGTLETRPYVPQAEFALGQALRVNQEFRRVDTGATKSAQMAVTPTRIVVGDDLLHLYDHNLVSRATFDVGATGPIEAVIAAPDGRIIAYSNNAILVVRDDRLLYAQQFDESVQIACATWQPRADNLLLCLGQSGEMGLWRWSPFQRPQNELQQIVTNLDPDGPTDRHGARWSPDGARLAVWGGNLMVWEPENGRLRIFPEDRSQDGASYVQFAVWSADSRALLSAWDGDSQAYLWSLTDPESVQPIEIGSRLLGAHALTARATEEMSMVLWTRDARAVSLDIGLERDNAAVGRSIRYVDQRPFHLPGAIGSVRGVVSADAVGAMVDVPATALMDSGQVFLWRPTTGAQACSGQHDAAVLDAAWRGDYFATAGGDGVVRIWQSAGDGDTPCMTLTKLPRQSRAVVALAWLDAARLLTLSEADPDETDPGALRIWSIFDEDGRPVCRQGSADEGLECLTYSAPIPTWDAQGDIADVHWLDYETVLVEEVVETGVTWHTWQLQSNGRLQEVTDGRHRWPFPIPETAKLAWNPAGTQVLIYGWENGGVIQRWERGQWQEQTLFREPVVSAQWLKTGSFWRVETGQGYYLAKDKRLHEIPGMPVVVSEAADMVLAVLDDQDTVRVWSFKEDEPKLLFAVTESALLQGLESRLTPELSRIHAVAASADGRYLAATVETGDLVVWDLENQGKMMSWAYPTEKAANLPFAWHPQLPAVVTAQSGEIFVLSVREKPIRTPDEDPAEAVEGVSTSAVEGDRIGWIRSGPIAGDIRHVAWYGEPDRILVQDGHYARLWQWESKENLLHEIMRVPHTASSHPLLNRGGDRLITRDDTWGWRIWEVWPSYERLVAEAERVIQLRANAE